MGLVKVVFFKGIRIQQNIQPLTRRQFALRMLHVYTPLPSTLMGFLALFLKLFNNFEHYAAPLDGWRRAQQKAKRK